MKTNLKTGILTALAIWLLGCITVTEVPAKGGKISGDATAKKGEVVPRVPFRIDPRYAEWYTNRAVIHNSLERARREGDFLRANALYFKSAYAEHFFKHFERHSPTGSHTKQVRGLETRIEDAKERREIQRKFKNAAAVAEIDEEIRRHEKALKDLTKEIPEQTHAADFVIKSMLERHLGGIMFFLAYSKNVPVKEDSPTLKSLREYRVGLASSVSGSNVPPEVAKKALKLNETLVKIEEHCLNARPAEAQMLAHKVATDILNQE